MYADRDNFIYTFEFESYREYDDIGFEQNDDGWMKCGCSGITDYKENFSQETRVDGWETADAKEVRTDKMTGQATGMSLMAAMVLGLFVHMV